MLVLTQKEGESTPARGRHPHLHQEGQRQHGAPLHRCPEGSPILRVPATPSRRPFQRPEGVEEASMSPAAEEAELGPEGSPVRRESSLGKSQRPPRQRALRAETSP